MRLNLLGDMACREIEVSINKIRPKIIIFFQICLSIIIDYLKLVVLYTLPVLS